MPELTHSIRFSLRLRKIRAFHTQNYNLGEKLHAHHIQFDLSDQSGYFLLAFQRNISTANIFIFWLVLFFSQNNNSSTGVILKEKTLL